MMNYSKSTTDNEEEEKKDNDLANQWLSELDAVRKKLNPYYKRCRDIIKRYLNKADISFQVYQKRKQFNVLWSNIQILQPTIYSRMPKPEVERRFKDKDPVAKIASQSLERALEYNMQDRKFDLCARRVRDDALLTGSGTARVRYLVETAVEEQQIPIVVQGGQIFYADGTPFSGDQNSIQETPQGLVSVEQIESIIDEGIAYDYVHWDDFTCQDSRTWEECAWVAFDNYLTRQEATKRFGKEKAALLNYYFTRKRSDENASAQSTGEYGKKACVTEIWCKSEKKVFWVSKGVPTLLDQKDDPLKLKEFFPCPRPLRFTSSNDTMVPTPDFDQYEVWADICDEYTRRIHNLIKAIKRRGIYDPSAIDLERITNELDETELVPAKDWPHLIANGGIDGVMQFMPVRELVQALNEAFTAFDYALAKIYELIGISDIVRGNTAPNETATAQQMKGQFYSLRVSERQQEMQRFCRDLIALSAEALVENVSSETFVQMAGVEFMAQEQPDVEMLFPQSYQLLQNDKLRSFRVSIETDSTISTENAQDKEMRLETLNTLTQFLVNLDPIAQQDPSKAPLIYQMMQFGLRGFKTGRMLEATLDGMINASQQQAQLAQQQAEANAGQPPPPTPEEIEAQSKAQAQQQELMLKQQKMEQEAAIKEAVAINEQRLAQQKAMAEQELAEYKIVAQQQLERMKVELEGERAEREMLTKQVMEQRRIEQENVLNTILAASTQKKEVSAETSQREPAIPVININNGGSKQIKLQRAPDGTLIGESRVIDDN